MKKDIIIHPLLFALFPTLSLFVHNADRLLFHEVIGTVLVVFVLAILLWLLLDLLVKNKAKSAVIVSIFLALFFSYSHVNAAVTDLLHKIRVLDDTDVLFFHGTTIEILRLCVLGGIFGVAFYLTVKSSSDFRLPTQTLNVISFCLIMTIGVNWFFTDKVGGQEGIAAPNSVQVYWHSWLQDQLEEQTDDTKIVSNSLPDIYYVILDGYARNDILQEMYQFDNSENLSRLAQKGFYIADQSRANYCQTGLSLSSSLNFMYLDDLASQIGRECGDLTLVATAISNNRLFQYLRHYGYTIVAFSTGFPITEVPNADIYMSPPWGPNSFQNELINTTPLTVFRKTQYDFHRERIFYTFDHLADAAKIDSPTFVFAHIVAPHPPFVLGANGEHIQPDRPFTFFDGSDFTNIAGRQEYVEGYRNQLIFTTTLLQATIDEILSRSAEQPIIILQADHGPGSMLDWRSAQNSNLPERMAIFNAYYFPDQSCEALYPGITPVNTFRVILNRYFGADYEILEDKNYFSILDRPYLFIDVTDELSSGSPR